MCTAAHARPCRDTQKYTGDTQHMIGMNTHNRDDEEQGSHNRIYLAGSTVSTTLTDLVREARPMLSATQQPAEWSARTRDSHFSPIEHSVGGGGR